VVKKGKLRLKIPRLRRKSDDKALDKARDFIRGENQTGETSPDRITNETVAKHREAVLSGARRFIYPLKASKHRIAIISSSIIAIVLVVFMVLSWYLLYQRQSIGEFAYRISQVIPFPVARVDGQFVRYEEYLFELRQNVHYLINQENVDFATPEGRSQLEGLKQQSIEKVVDSVIIRQLADEKGITVTDHEVEEQINLIRSSGGIGDSSQTLEDTLEDFYGWDLGDLKRVIKAQVLKQKLVPIFDPVAKVQAQEVLDDIKNGENFARAAKAHSEDEFTKDNGGEFGYIFRSNTDIPPQIVEKAFSLGENEVADDLVETLFGWHIVKNLKYRSDNEALIAHILIRFEDASSFINNRKDMLDISRYIST